MGIHRVFRVSFELARRKDIEIRNARKHRRSHNRILFFFRGVEGKMDRLDLGIGHGFEPRFCKGGIQRRTRHIDVKNLMVLETVFRGKSKSETGTRNPKYGKDFPSVITQGGF